MNKKLLIKNKKLKGLNLKKIKSQKKSIYNNIITKSRKEKNLNRVNTPEGWSIVDHETYLKYHNIFCEDTNYILYPIFRTLFGARDSEEIFQRYEISKVSELYREILNLEDYLDLELRWGDIPVFTYISSLSWCLCELNEIDNIQAIFSMIIEFCIEFKLEKEFIEDTSEQDLFIYFARKCFEFGTIEIEKIKFENKENMIKKRQENLEVLLGKKEYIEFIDKKAILEKEKYELKEKYRELEKEKNELTEKYRELELKEYEIEEKQSLLEKEQHNFICWLEAEKYYKGEIEYQQLLEERKIREEIGVLYV
ncbi:hypothetical protein DB313_05255 (plasmid) [Borrelia turcica IST7]|uniref:Uncharacterized protein n=1 Tax=Borrelia turcica IST7 TaxID=1104446 RepID=A0A386PPM2_9SPIR|nr:hypothetical protein [Borrelia turcica]AYE36909.1 hypothetical protein DB313_05255 [Borrelia turcica IST7]